MFKVLSSIDGVQHNKYIAELFKGKFDHLFNCVSYNKDELNILNNDINSIINSESLQTNNSNTLLIGPDLVKKGIANLKGVKMMVEIH